MKRIVFSFSIAIALLISCVANAAAACTQTGFYRDTINMTAALIDPVGTVTGVVDATGCNIGIYYDNLGAGGTVKAADIYGANYFGVLVNGDAGAVGVDIISSKIHDIGENPHNGSQHGVAVYYRGFFPVSAATGKISGNQVYRYQKGGVVANGQGTQVTISDNIVTGDGDVTFIAMNGVQVGYGATGTVMRNTVSGNSFVGNPGDGSSSGGVIVVGGAGYGACPDGNDCPYTVGVMVQGNTLTNNNVGVYFSNLKADYSAPDDATNDKAVNNTISSTCFNTIYNAGVSDVGNNDKIINNKISGAGYLASCTAAFGSFAVDASTSFTNNPKVHANK